MLIGKSVSFRSQLVSNTLDLIKEINLNCAHTSQLVAGIVSSLAAYTEEGVPMTPTVFICNSISTLLQRAGTGEHVPLSEEIDIGGAESKILKAAAPLCKENWKIYIERSSDGARCKFGVFCGSSDPSSLTVDEVLLDGTPDGFPIVRIAQSAINKVEVRTNAGKGVEFRFNDDEDIHSLDSQKQVKNLAHLISSKVSSHSDSFTGFVERVLSSAIKQSHGTLISVISSDKDLPSALQDVVKLSPSLDLFTRFKLHQDEGKTAISVSRLQAASELVSGFICSDGITIFNTSGCILGYRAFIRSKEDAPSSSGGARTRAFNAMQLLVGGDLDAAFFRSQDGKTELHQCTGAISQ